MTSLNSYPEATACSAAQVECWLQALLTIAWADGDFDASEQQLVADLMQHPITDADRPPQLTPISPAALTAAFGMGSALAQDFLRTAVMVAIADGVYTSAEDTLLTEFATALGTGDAVLQALRQTLIDPVSSQPNGVECAESMNSESLLKPKIPAIDPLSPVRVWLDGMQIQDPKVAHFLCRLIPSQCPFERDVVLFGKKVVHIPPMCKLNPLYEQLVGLRFRALSYLADDRGEDISSYL
ncbi:MAG: hypothetical protein RLZZ511_2189 [Cyanobacteriota bacterium]|jgi:tellurite resistance protein